eukprot:CAMPEP_0170073408 /NCGR_PEP_ID=MMETSP0019_2-20121128/10842_1 /TAXON_ID=98059 /ORGANISM="Dinobryon sp., Strain UTEXLB2267" /LENGTH=219 /DNA_ID=CAMNT_0010282941 /DNA_START=60 /DNA_END=721 /DNA_ORIENTATION=+
MSSTEIITSLSSSTENISSSLLASCTVGETFDDCDLASEEHSIIAPLKNSPDSSNNSELRTKSTKREDIFMIVAFGEGHQLTRNDNEIGLARTPGWPLAYRPVGYAAHQPKQVKQLSKREAATHIGQVVARKWEGRKDVGSVIGTKEVEGEDGNEMIVWTVNYPKQHNDEGNDMLVTLATSSIDKKDNEDFNWKRLCEAVRLYKEHRRLIETNGEVELD